MKYLLIILVFLSLCANAQEKEDSIMQSYLSDVKLQLSNKDYSGAQTTLKKIVALSRMVPDEVAFRYGQLQLGLQFYVKAEEAFLKYLQLTDNRGPYAKECDSLLSVAQKNICTKCHNSGWREEVDTCAICEGKGKVIKACADCAGKGKVFCQTCGGQGVVFKATSVGPVYQSCLTCSGTGIAPCYYCSGTARREVFCTSCKAKGIFKKSVVCDHKH